MQEQERHKSLGKNLGRIGPDVGTLATSISHGTTKFKKDESPKACVRCYSCGKLGHCLILQDRKRRELNTSKQELEGKLEERQAAVRRTNFMSKEVCLQLSRSQNEHEPVCMMVDSGASEHATVDQSLFQAQTEEDEVEMELEDGTGVKSQHKGKMLVDFGMETVILNKVYFILTLDLNNVMFKT